MCGKIFEQKPIVQHTAPNVELNAKRQEQGHMLKRKRIILKQEPLEELMFALNVVSLILCEAEVKWFVRIVERNILINASKRLMQSTVLRHMIC